MKIYRNSKNFFRASTTATNGTVLFITQTENSSELILNKEVSQDPTSTNVDVNFSLAAGNYTIKILGLNELSEIFDRAFVRNSDSEIIVQDIYNNTPKTFTLSEDTNVSRFVIVADSTSVYTNQTVTVMINSGSSAIPYEPYNVVDWYGYKYKLRASGAWSELDDKKAPWEVTSNAKKKKSVLGSRKATKGKT